MKAYKLLLPAIALGVAMTALAQDATPPSSQTPPLRVIVPWTHFGQKPANASPGTSAPPSEAAPLGSNAAQPGNPNAAPGDPAAPADQVNGQAPATASTAPPDQAPPQSQLYEADISKKHPHPPEPVALPPADLSVPPLASLSPSELVPPSPPGLTPVPVLPAGAAASNAQLAPASAQPANLTPSADIEAVSDAYEARRAARESELQQLHAGAAKEAPEQEDMQVTRLELEGEQDRMRTAQTLIKDYASLADEFDERAAMITKMLGDRTQVENLSQAQLDQLKALTPRRELALQNLAQLPPGAENDETIQGLQAALTEGGSQQKLADERHQEALQEIAGLNAEANELKQAAEKARARSRECARALDEARSNEDRLADRMEYYQAREGAASLLTGASKALAGSTPLAAGTASPPRLPAPESPRVSASQEAAAGSLRECIRKTGKVDACLATGGAQ